MTGWRIGMAVGNADIIRAMAISKNNNDSGVFNAVQYAAIDALNSPDSEIDRLNAIYQKRRDLVVDALNSIGLKVKKPKATFYIWAPVPKGYSSQSFAAKVLDEAAVVITPGNGYGQYGEGHVRISLTVPDNRLKEAMERMRKVRV